jgi:hypothetical protein
MIISFFYYVILFPYSLICHYMDDNRSWHTYICALGFLWKNRCDTQRDNNGDFGNLQTCLLLSPSEVLIDVNGYLGISRFVWCLVLRRLATGKDEPWPESLLTGTDGYSSHKVRHDHPQVNKKPTNLVHYNMQRGEESSEGSASEN